MQTYSTTCLHIIQYGHSKILCGPVQQSPLDKTQKIAHHSQFSIVEKVVQVIEPKRAPIHHSMLRVNRQGAIDRVGLWLLLTAMSKVTPTCNKSVIQLSSLRRHRTGE